MEFKAAGYPQGAGFTESLRTILLPKGYLGQMGARVGAGQRVVGKVCVVESQVERGCFSKSRRAKIKTRSRASSLGKSKPSGVVTERRFKGAHVLWGSR